MGAGDDFETIWTQCQKEDKERRLQENKGGGGCVIAFLLTLSAMTAGTAVACKFMDFF